MAAIAILAGIGATVQNVRGGERRAPRWLPAMLLLVAGVCAGAIAVSLIPQPTMTRVGVSPQLMTALPALTTANLRFDQAGIRVKTGETVRCGWITGTARTTRSTWTNWACT